MSGLYSKFVPLLSRGARILDAGCGSGRDSLYFEKQGFSVTAFDASHGMTKYASELIGRPVPQLRFQNMEYTDEFDGVWACASLLHVPETELPAVYCRLARSMRNNAVLYCSFKYGTEEVESNGRRFTNMSAELFEKHMRAYPELSIIDIWQSNDLRKGREKELWFNALVRKIVAK